MSQQKKQTSKTDINVELYEYIPRDDIKLGRLELLCYGEDCNEQFINAIGRICVERLPTYAYAKELIKIEKINRETGFHDSIPFNHDMMRDRLKNTPVMNIDPEIAILHERYWKNVDYRDPERQIHEKEKRIEVYIKGENTHPEGSDTIKHITTNDIEMFIDDEKTNLYSKEYPLLLISLKPREAFKCYMKAVLGVGVNDTCWDACSNFCFDQETEPDKIIAKFQASPQFDEFTLVSRGIEYFKYRTKLLKDEIKRMYLLDGRNDERFLIIINDEDHTMGEPINYEIQSHPDIRKSSVSKPNHLIKSIHIDVVAFEKSKLLDAVMESIDNLMNKIEKFEQEFNKINTRNGEKIQKKTENKKAEEKKKSKSKGK